MAKNKKFQCGRCKKEYINKGNFLKHKCKVEVEVEAESLLCPYCGKIFKREGCLVKHRCKIRDRYVIKDEKAQKIGYIAFTKFFKYAYNNETKTLDDFIRSNYYKAFVKFGEYCVATKCLKVDQFITYVILQRFPLDSWASDQTYTKYLEHMLLSENSNDALERTLEYSIKWATIKEMYPEDIFRYGSITRICHDIQRGKISPWVLYNSESGKDFLQKLNAEQMNYIWNIIDVDKWSEIFDKRSDEVKFISKVMKEAGW